MTNYGAMIFAKDANNTEEVVAISPWDIQVIVHGETFPAKRFKEHIIAASENRSTRSDIAGFIEVGEWLTDAERVNLRRLMSLPNENPSTVFQLVVNVQPMRRLICEWPHASIDCENADRYYFTQLADLDK
jgi:hypothetical protein